MKAPIKTAADIVPEFPTHWTVRAFQCVGFMMFGYFFFSGRLFAGLFWLILFFAFGMVGSEYRRKQLTTNFWYSSIRSFYVIGLPNQYLPEAFLSRFDRFGFVVFTDNNNVTKLCADIDNELEESSNDKKGVTVHGIAFDFGQRKGETVEEYEKYVEDKVWSMIRKEEKALLKHARQDSKVLEWYVKQGAGNDTLGSKHIVK